MIDIQALLPEVKRVILQAGDILLHYFSGEQINHISHKGVGNIVSDADLESERFLIDVLGDLLPAASFFAEESGQSGEGEYCWVIDPLDGTTNFAHGLNYFCISIALTYQGKPVLGCIYRPVGKELFWAVQGQGAFCNGNRLEVSSISTIKDAFVGSCLPYESSGQFERGLRTFTQIARNVTGIRKMGAAALDLAHVASGTFDAVLFEGLGWWDVAAGMLLVTEAGGRVTDYKGMEIDSVFRSFIASNGQLHQALKEIIGENNSMLV